MSPQMPHHRNITTLSNRHLSISVRQLEAYSYPLNITELKTMVERAAAQSDNSGRKLSEDVFWFAKQVGGWLRSGAPRAC